MATRQVRDDPPVVHVKKNRRPLWDIGNMASIPRVQGGKINRPLTRNFFVKFLENAQAANNKKQTNLDKASVLDGAANPKKPETVKAVQKKARDTNVVAKAKKDKKKVSYSSVLNARSKAASSKTHDIDSVDDLAAVEYAEDIYTFYKQAENESKPQMYKQTQPEINEKMRSILIDWLVDVHVKLDLSPETLYLTVNIIDRFLSLKPLPRRELQLLGVSALLIASKYEEVWPPQVNDLVYVTDDLYNDKQILVMEKTISGTLEWYLTVPTQYVFLARFIKAGNPNPVVENMVYFLAELGMMEYDTLNFSPSLLAASTVFTARCFLNMTPAWTDALRFHTRYSGHQLMECSRVLAETHWRVSREEGKKLQQC